MKTLLTVLLLALHIYVFSQTATIKIDVDRTIGEIDPKIYGVFMEPIHFNGARMGCRTVLTLIHSMETYTIRLHRLPMRMGSGRITSMQ